MSGYLMSYSESCHVMSCHVMSSNIIFGIGVLSFYVRIVRLSYVIFGIM